MSPKSPNANTTIPRAQYSERPTLHLPTEVLLNIISSIPHHPHTQPTLYACCLVSQAWYCATISRLYQSPGFTGKNYVPFVRTVCPSINAHIRESQLAAFVRRLDMSRLVHDGSKSLTGRLLGRVKGRLEEFVAPQTSFAINSLSALSKCHNLRILDLSLICESLRVNDLLRAVSTLENLDTFHFPRCSPARDPGPERLGNSGKQARWPDRVRTFHIPVGLSTGYLSPLLRAPPTLTSLTIEDGSGYTPATIDYITIFLGPQLLTLRLLFGYPCGRQLHFEFLLARCPNLLHLTLQADYFSHGFGGLIKKSDDKWPLQSLVILRPTSEEEWSYSKELPSVLFDLVAEGKLGELRRVELCGSVCLTSDREWKQDLVMLSELMESLEKESQEREAANGPRVAGVTSSEMAGVWLYGGGYEEAPQGWRELHQKML